MQVSEFFRSQVTEQLTNVTQRSRYPASLYRKKKKIENLNEENPLFLPTLSLTIMVALIPRIPIISWSIIGQ